MSIIRLAVLYFSSARYFDVISPEVYLCMVCLALILNLVVYLAFGIQAASKRTQWSSRTVERWLNKTWTETEIRNIRVGDLIRIKSGQFCPVDILLLSTTEIKTAHKIVHVNEKTITGSNNLAYKQPIRDFPKDMLQSEEERSLFSGMVEYSTPNADTEGILGIFKIKNDPRVTPIKSNNLIFAGSVVFVNEVTGFVLYTGVNTKFSQKTGILDFKRLRKVFKSESSMTTLVDTLSLFFTVLSLYTAFCLLLYYDEDSLQAQRAQMIWKVSKYGWSGPRTYFQVISIITSVLPHFLAILQELINVFVGFRFQQRTGPKENLDRGGLHQNELVRQNNRLQLEENYVNSEPNLPVLASPLFSERVFHSPSMLESPINMRGHHRSGFELGTLNGGASSVNHRSKHLSSGGDMSMSSPEPHSRRQANQNSRMHTPGVEPFSLPHDAPSQGGQFGRQVQAPAQEIKLQFKHTTSLGQELERLDGVAGQSGRGPISTQQGSVNEEQVPIKKPSRLANFLSALEKVFKPSSSSNKSSSKPHAEKNTEEDQGEDFFDLFGKSKISKSSEEQQKRQQAKNVFEIQEGSWSRVLNPSLITNLGNIDHVVFDKTDTLTMSRKQIVFFSTLKRTYNLLHDDDSHLQEDLADQRKKSQVPFSQKVEEFQKNPVFKGEERNNGYYEDPEQAQDDYDEFYDEKSQEYHKELEVEFDSKLFQEDSQFEEIRQIMKMPNFMPQKDNSISRENPSSMVGKEDLTEFNSRPKLEFMEPLSLGSVGRIPNGTKPVLHQRELSGQVRNSTMEDLFFQENLPFKRGRKPTHIKGTTVSHLSYRDLMMFDEMGDSEEQDEIIELEDEICQLKTQNAFLYDNYTRSEEIEYMFCACGLFLYCGMTELIQQFTPTHINTAISEFLDAMKVRVWSPDATSESTSQQPGSGSLPRLQSTKKVSLEDFQGYRVTISSDFGMMRHFVVLGYNPRTDGREITSMIVAIPGASKDQYYLLVRGDEQQMRAMLDLSPQEQTIFRNLMIQYKQLLLSRTIFAWKRLTDVEAAQYSAGYLQIIKSGRSDLSSLPRLTLALEHKLRLIGCIGFKSQLRDDAFKLIENLKKAEFKISMISGDTYENTIHVAKELKLGENTGGLDAFRIHFENADRGHFELTNQLESVYHVIKQKNNHAFDHYLQYLLSSGKSSASEKKGYLEEVEGHLFAGEDYDFAKVFQRPMIISGPSLKLIQSYPRLEVLFKALCVFAHSFICYDFEAMQKADIVNLLKEFDQKVLTIGDGVNDLSMFRAGDISIQLETENVPFHFGDLIVNRLDIIQKLIFIDGFALYKSVRLSLMFAVVTISKFIIANIWIYTRSGFSTRYLSPLYTTVLLAMIVGDSVFRGISQGTYSDFLLSSNPFIYQERIVLDSQLLVFVACFVLNILIEIGVLFFMLNLASQFLFSTGRFVEHEIQIAFVFFMLFLNMAYFSYSLYRHRPPRGSITMLVGHHFLLIAILLYHQYQKVAPLASTFDLREVFGDLSFLTCLFIVILVPTYFNFLMSYVILHKLINPVRYYLMHTLGKSKGWQTKIEPSDLKFLKLAIGRIRRNADRSVINLISQFTKVCSEFTRDHLVDPILSKMMLIDMHTFTAGINQLTNQILDNRMSSKYMKLSRRVAAKLTSFVLIFTLVSLVVVTAAILLQSSIKLDVFRFHDFWKIIALLAVVIYLRWKQPEPNANFINPVTLALLAVVLIDLIFIPIDWVSETEHSKEWIPNFFDNRLISSPVPLDFYLTCGLLGVLDVTKIIRTIYMRGPIDLSVNYWVYSFIILLHMVGFVLIQWSMKKKVVSC